MTVPVERLELPTPGFGVRAQTLLMVCARINLSSFSNASNAVLPHCVYAGPSCLNLVLLTLGQALGQEKKPQDRRLARTRLATAASAR
jgi:hypothetical protein